MRRKAGRPKGRRNKKKQKIDPNSYVWTDKVPTEPGFYYFQKGATTTVDEVRAYACGCLYFRGQHVKKELQDALWAGPLSEPVFDNVVDIEAVPEAKPLEVS